MTAFPEELAINSLKGLLFECDRGYMTTQRALEVLKEESGKDFGMDIDAWDKWVKQRMQERFDKYGSE